MYEKLRNKPKIKIIFTLLAVYFILIEFILPPSKYLPSFSIIYDSLNSLINEFALLTELSEFLAFVYVPLLIVLLFFYSLRKYVIIMFLRFSKLFEIVSFFWFLPAVFILFYAALIINHTASAEIFISVIVSSGLLKYFIIKKLGEIDDTYALAAKGLGIPVNRIYSEVISKQILPFIKEKVLFIHIILLNVLLIYEIINREFLGYIYYQLYSFKDSSGILSLTILLWIIFGMNHLLLKYILNKFIYWEE